MARNKGFFFPILVIVALIIAVVQVSLLPMEDLNLISSYALYPLLVVQKKIAQPITSYRHYRRSNDELELLVRSMREKQEQLLQENIQLKATLYYSNQIKELVDFKKRYQCNNAVVSQVLSKNFSEQNHFFLIDAGLNKGLEKDMVVVYKNNLLGKIVQVYPWYSKVILITDRTCKVAACCVASGALGVHEGQNSQINSSLNYVSHLATVKVDDLVISSGGDGLIFPRGFALGKVVAYNRDELLYHVSIKPLIDMQTIDYCMVLPKGFTGITPENNDQASNKEQPAVAATKVPAATQATTILSNNVNDAATNDKKELNHA